jgi:hypothetical protein
MSREKIKVPGKAYEEIIALQREIHFTNDHQDTIKKAQDRGYMNAANWIRQNVDDYKIGFAWGFEPADDEPKGTLKEIPVKEAPAPKRTISRPPTPKSKKSQKSTGSAGILASIKKLFGK